MAKKNRHPYDDIIDLPHPVSKVHSPMPIADRAAQFSPFAALTGFEEVLKETGRFTEKKLDLGEDARNTLDEKLRMIQEQTGNHPQAAITYFQPDDRKAGGVYMTVTGRVKKIDIHARTVEMQDGTKVPVEEIVEIEGELFSGSEGEEFEKILGI